MKAKVGDRLRFLGHQVGAPDHFGRVVEVMGKEGDPPYLVEFDDGHRAEVFPGTDCELEHAGAHHSAA
ncbi:DUF1918 domain-containing protein [Streptacidiphilus fuscans]|uniref:DUF1918 domain-containing protein n=1 Tax=Streptacidiphilus fuscans TaxID=2789292 RepID=A0A931FFV9_9ACTN|nr:DUF1918 domain-containing protein [Streptacidiphilus fuscans]MBF9068809.1 DUF1918 domain-containing protein [Streptacidiphilus fuscans]